MVLEQDPPDWMAEPTKDEGAQPGSSKRWLLVGGAIAAALVIAVVALALLRGSDDDQPGQAIAAGPNLAGGGADGQGFPGGFPGANGQVTAIEGATLTVESNGPNDATSTISVIVSDDTDIVEMVRGDLGALQVGDEVTVVGDEDGDSIAATSISEGSTGGFPAGGQGPGRGGQPPEGFEPPEEFDPNQAPNGGAGGARPGGAGAFGAGFQSGTVVSIGDDQLTIETTDGEQVTVTVSDDTSIVVSEPRTLADIDVGDSVRATGETDGDTVTATTVFVGDTFAFGPGQS